MITRRRFIKGAATGAAAVSLPGVPLAQAPAKRTIIDAQVHLWLPESPTRPWIPGMHPQLPEPFTIEKVLPMMSEAGVDRIVIVPPSWEGDRNDYALEAAAKYPDKFAVMGRIPLRQPDIVRPLLAKWKDQKGMLGIRLTFLGPAAKWLDDGTADWIWPEAEKARLPIMFLTTGVLPKFAPIAERHPGLPLIIDHMGLTLQVFKDGRREEVVASAAALAKYPNVSVKLSATPANSTEPYPWKDMNDNIKRLFDAFGPQRCYWGTDITNSLPKATYRQRVTHFTEALGFLSEADKDLVMGRAIMQRLGWA
jgi:predicted TIM-barrel fold metal-dependent hydrolase